MPYYFLSLAQYVLVLVPVMVLVLGQVLVRVLILVLEAVLMRNFRGLGQNADNRRSVV